MLILRIHHYYLLSTGGVFAPLKVHHVQRIDAQYQENAEEYEGDRVAIFRGQQTITHQ